MLKSGIIDPAKVTHGTVEGAASFTAMILTAEVVMVEIAELQLTKDEYSGKKTIV